LRPFWAFYGVRRRCLLLPQHLWFVTAPSQDRWRRFLPGLAPVTVDRDRWVFRNPRSSMEDLAKPRVTSWPGSLWQMDCCAVSPAASFRDSRPCHPPLDQHFASRFSQPPTATLRLDPETRAILRPIPAASTIIAQIAITALDSPAATNPTLEPADTRHLRLHVRTLPYLEEELIAPSTERSARSLKISLSGFALVISSSATRRPQTLAHSCHDEDEA